MHRSPLHALVLGFALTALSGVADAGPDNGSRPTLAAATEVMFEERDALCASLATEHGRLTAAGAPDARLDALSDPEAWRACRRHSPYGAIPRWRHMDELVWCRDEYDTYAPIRSRIESEAEWLRREYGAIRTNGVSPERVEAYNARSREYQLISQRHTDSLARYAQRCTGYRTSPTYTVELCRGRDNGFCSR
jgi:hypothetical protein